MTGWVPVSDPPSPDDHHTWARPASAACPDCDCCTEALCKLAIESSDACHLVGSSGDFDLSRCPCWQKAMRAAMACLDGTPAAAVALLADVPVEQLAEYGGMPGQAADRNAAPPPEQR